MQDYLLAKMQYGEWRREYDEWSQPRPVDTLELLAEGSKSRS